jgi:hypothetical protein
MGPLTIFDKSALQSFSMDESVWFDAFFMGNVTPLFYVETLADLEKSVKAGKTPEQIVGRLAEKTPSHAVPNVYHRTLILNELAGQPVEMDTRPIVGGGIPKRTPGGKISVEFDTFPESAALNRWRNNDFMEIERVVARSWRVELSRHDPDILIGRLKNILPTGLKLSNLQDLKTFIDSFCNGNDKELLNLMMDILELPDQGRPKVIARWEAAGKPSLSQFAPYATHVFKVDLVYYLGIHRGFISGVRPSNKVDMAYLYYLPFCQVFVSGDNLHARTVPLFLQANQAYVSAPELKVALQKLDKHYDGFPDEIKQLGVMQFVGYPPSTLNNIVTELWDKLMRHDWRKIAKQAEDSVGKPVEQPQGKEFVADMRKQMKESVPLRGSEVPASTEDVDQVIVTRTMPVHKGKWRMVSEEVEKSGDAANS